MENKTAISSSEKTVIEPDYNKDIHDKILDAYYGRMGDTFMHETHRRIHWVCNHVVGKQVLDVGCSQGLVPVLLAREGMNVSGLDSDNSAIDQAKNFIGSENIHVQKKVEWILDDFISYDFGSHTFDTVLMTEILEHLVKPGEFIRKASELLKPDGTIIVTVPFGINDFIDHKHTFYLSAPHTIISSYFDIQQYEILGGWLGIIAKKKSEKQEKAPRTDLQLDMLKNVEQAFLNIEKTQLENLKKTKFNLLQANNKYKNLCEINQKLKTQLQHAETKTADTLQNSKIENNTIKTKLIETQNTLERANLAYKNSTEEANTIKTKLIETRNTLEKANLAHKNSILEANSLKATMTSEALKIKELNISLQNNEEAKKELDRIVKEKSLELENVSNKLSDGRVSLDKIKKEKQIVSEELSSYTEKCSSYVLEIQKQKTQNRESHKSILALKRDIEILARDKKIAEQQVIKTRKMLSFQLGHLLINEVRTLNQLFNLPKRLLQIRKEARLRSKKKSEKMYKSNNKTKIILPKSTVKIEIGQISNKKNTYFDLPGKRSDIKVACIMDEFTYGCYDPECNLMQLTPANWLNELQTFMPEMLFIESAWRGKNDLWGNKVGHNSNELQGIIEWCDHKNIPTIFWNKEDPVHFETFLNTAKNFDIIFTTDIDCIAKYKSALGHNKIYLLPFACQPKTHNPLEKYTRKDAFCFAGAYYVKYPERTKDLENFIYELPEFRPLEIFDRNFHNTDVNYKFPQEYNPYIVGTLPFEEIDKAYKGYEFAINLNSIKQSQSMFARRVFELLASNTITVSNFSKGVRLLFGELVISSDSGDKLVQELNKLEAQPLAMNKLRLTALRKVMSEHTYEHRFTYITSKLTNKKLEPIQPKIAILAQVNSIHEIESIKNNYFRQNYDNSELFIVTCFDKNKYDQNNNNNKLNLMAIDEINAEFLSSIRSNFDFITWSNHQDYYGINFLTDLSLATKYCKLSLIGKSSYYSYVNGEPKLNTDQFPYQQSNSLSLSRAILKVSNVDLANLIAWFSNKESVPVIQDINALVTDIFNYCEGAGHDFANKNVSIISDITNRNSGIGIDDLLSTAEAIQANIDVTQKIASISGKSFGKVLAKTEGYIESIATDDDWKIRSALEDGQHQYIYSNKIHSLSELNVNNEIRLFFDCTLGLNIQIVVFFMDDKKQKIGHLIKPCNSNISAELPFGTEYIKFGVRIYAAGTAIIKQLLLDHKMIHPIHQIASSDILLITNHYPSYDDLYRNGFVHTRVTAYKDKGVNINVLRLRPNQVNTSYHEFNGVDVTTGNKELLKEMLDSGQYRHILVHFLDSDMWSVLDNYIDKIKVTVWVHGAEIQPWWRRQYNYTTESELEKAKIISEVRSTFWKKILQPMHSNLKLIFVSKYSCEEVMKDLGFSINTDQYDIIHNPIDTELFSYVKKPAKQRKKILSIRPFASSTYANDLSVKMIEELSSEDWFNSLEFRIIGDGVLFEEITKPLEKYSNVIIQRGFLTQQEIANIHKDYGVFLCPTRMDSQGVSRDEAMSSGLVPITNNVAAIPEFVENDSGILAGKDDYIGMAEGLKRLILDDGYFNSLSEAASARVFHKLNKECIISRELNLFEKKD
jgi:2-polyprenyl-3-methyl-5-hydroxy-6-metoxy-1,4-benzoquinol methylase/glycosyltransferase involved in cell wall biosynthesis/spore maturation protein CgeB